ncbi:uncharacterized protein LOC111193934 isoform X1 [Astyanax mexicanus]|uniref:uncharacterized protein LOC111193934 isoform X1 n=1 Tax=Astyanax mexicanus TaxID=7994 RepID=UPI0020CAFD4B|nr:uncharacterized protein LOC111193934 isoform X1 [Astyanax mexicanus]
MEFWRSEEHRLEGASGGSGDPFILLPFCGTEELRAACLQWQGEGPDPWTELRRVQHEFLEGKLRALIQKVESHCARDPTTLLPFCEEPDPWMELRRVQHEFLEGKLRALIQKVESHCARDPPTLLPVCEEPDPWTELRRVQLKFLEGKLKALIEKQLSCPRRRVGSVLVPVMEAALAHRLDSTEPDLPGPVAQCEEAPAPDLTTTSHPEPSSQGDTALSPNNNTQRRSLKRPVTNFRSSFVCRFRSPRRVLVQVEEADPSRRLDLQDTKPELEPVPAAQDEDDLENDVEVLELEHHRPGETAPNRKRGWLQHLLSCFRWKARKS